MSVVVFPEAFRFAMWLHAQAESNQLEGEWETAASLLSLRELVLDHPGDFEAYLLVRERRRNGEAVSAIERAEASGSHGS